MSGNNEDNIIALSKLERKKLVKFMDLFKKQIIFILFIIMEGKKKQNMKKKIMIMKAFIPNMKIYQIHQAQSYLN